MRNRFVLLGDLGFIALSAFGAFVLRLGWRFYDRYELPFLCLLAAALVLKPIAFFAFGMYQRFWRYASTGELIGIAGAVTVSSAVLALGVVVGGWWHPSFEFSRAVLTIDALLTLVLCGGLRLAVRVEAETRARNQRARLGSNVKRVLIAGAGDAGVMVLRELQRNAQIGLQPVGFLDDDPAKVGKQIHGLPVVADLLSLGRIVRSFSIDEVLIAMPTADGAVVRALADACRGAGVPSRTVPGVFELLDGKVSVSRLRQIDISDLLRRPPVAGDGAAQTYLRDRTVLVTGAGGSIGAELCRQVAAAGPACLVMLGHGENSLFEAQARLRESIDSVRTAVVVADIRDRPRLEAVFARWRPDVVFHAAAHKHVPMMEVNPEEVVSNNILGTRNVVEAATSAGVARLVMISTDKAVAPANLMGASKRVAERIVAREAARSGGAFVVVRFGNVLGSRGSVVPVFKRQIEQGGPITVTHPQMRRFFMTIPEAAHLVLQAGGMGTGGELFVLDMGPPVRIVDLVNDLIVLSGLAPGDVPITFTGTRPGEKIEEGLWEQDARVVRTPRESILRVIEAPICPDAAVDDMLAGLTRAAATGERLEIEAELARWVPSFVPAIQSHIAIR